jgi:DNA-binding Lrp family transcriptional regulator
LLRDEIDRLIVSALIDDARMSYREIGARVGLSAPAVKRRIDRLEAEGVICGYTTVVHLEEGEGSTEAFVELWCRDKTTPEQIAALVRAVPEVVAAYTISGDADALLHLRARTVADLDAVIERIRDHPDATRTRSLIVLAQLVGPAPRRS